MRISRIVLALPLLLAVLPAGADTNFTGDGWLTGVPVPGVLCTNSSGQVYLKGNIHMLRLLANDPRVTGRLEAMPHIAFQPDGTRKFTGTAYSEVGAWVGTNFTATGGVWDLLYRGVAQADGSLHYNIVGYGIGGTIDGLRTEIAASRGPGPAFDPSIPYTFSGTVKPAPINSNVVVDDFNDGILTGWTAGGNTSLPTLTEDGGLLTMGCDWTGIPTSGVLSTLAWAGHDVDWSAPDGQTVEVRVDLVDLNAATDSAVLAFAVQRGGPTYALLKGHGWMLLLKQSGMAIAGLCGKTVLIPETGEVLSLALTGVGQNLVLTARVFDKAEPKTVRGELNYVDTPAADAVLTDSQISGIIGANITGFLSDPGVPYKTGQRAWLGLWQNTDGTKPPAQASFDNCEFGTYEVPQVGIQRAVRLSWPATGMKYTIEAATGLRGTFGPVQDPAIPGVETWNLPANEPMEIFRVRSAP